MRCGMLKNAPAGIQAWHAQNAAFREIVHDFMHKMRKLRTRARLLAQMTEISGTAQGSYRLNDTYVRDTLNDSET